MRAALLVEPGRIVVDDVPQPEPGPDDVLIAVGGVGLCGSDLSLFRGAWTPPSYPWIQGHEGFGTIEAVGGRVSTSRVGETVVLEPNIVCGTCTQCRRGWTSACLGRQSVGMNRQGAIAERIVVPSANAWRVETAAPEHLVCLEPLTVVETALRRLPTPIPDAALVIGVGAQGLLMCLALLRRDVGVFVEDVNADRVAFAASLGAKALSDDEATRQFDLIVDTAGTADAIDFAVAHAQVGGTIVELGLEGRPFSLSAQTLVRRQLVLRGSLTYDHPNDFRTTLDLLVDGRVSPGCVVTDEYPLEDAQQAFERFSAARGKTWIRVRPRVPGDYAPPTAATAARNPSR